MVSYQFADTDAGRVPVVDIAQAAQVARRENASRAVRPHFLEIGVAGTEIIQGQVYNEEFNPDVTWKSGLRTYDRMRRTEPQIASTLAMIGLPIRSAEWKIAPGTPAPDDLERASFVETCLFHGMKRPWDDFLRHALIHLWAGFMLFEQTFRNENGKTVLADLAPRLPRTLNKWITDQHSGDLLAVEQWAYADNSYRYYTIPEEDLLRFTCQQEGNNYEGISILRTAYKPYFIKQNLERIMAVGFEREHVGIPVITLPQGHTENDKQRASKIGKNIRSHEMAYIVLSEGWDVTWLKGAGAKAGRGGSILETLYYLDRQLQQNVLAQFMSLGTTDVGSYALSNDQSRVFLMSLQSVARYIANTVNARTIKKLIDYNFAKTDVYPELMYQKIHAYNFVDLTASIANLVATGVIPPTAELEDYIYDLLGVPIAPRSLIETTNGVTGDVAGAAADVVDPATGEQGVRPRGTIIVRPTAKIANPGEQRNESAGGIGFHDAYLPAYTRLSDARQQRIFKRMAEEAGRPKVTLARGQYQFASAAPTDPRTAKHDALLKRRVAVSEASRKHAEATIADLSAEIEALLESAGD